MYYIKNGIKHLINDNIKNNPIKLEITHILSLNIFDKKFLITKIFYNEVILWKYKPESLSIILAV